MVWFGWTLIFFLPSNDRIKCSFILEKVLIDILGIKYDCLRYLVWEIVHQLLLSEAKALQAWGFIFILSLLVYETTREFWNLELTFGVGSLDKWLHGCKCGFSRTHARIVWPEFECTPSRGYARNQFVGISASDAGDSMGTDTSFFHSAEYSFSSCFAGDHSNLEKLHLIQWESLRLSISWNLPSSSGIQLVSQEPISISDITMRLSNRMCWTKQFNIQLLLFLHWNSFQTGLLPIFYFVQILRCEKVHKMSEKDIDWLVEANATVRERSLSICFVD